MEDNLLEAARQVGARLDSAVDAISSRLDGPGAPAGVGVQQAAETLINEVWAVVDASYMDARQAGFDRGKWAELRDKALARRYKDVAAVHRAVRDMVARGLPDPYCRWVPPREFAAMRKYDVTGVGLNLGTAEEYVKKTGRELPGGRRGADGDVWVVGISKGSAADVAGLEQGDQIISVGGAPLVDASPFQASALIAGPVDDEGGGGGGGGGGGAPVEVVLRARKAGGRLEDYAVPRPVVQLASPVRSALQARGGGRKVGVIAIRSFTARAQRDVAAAVGDLAARGADELELDLRDNRGGLVTEGLEVARLFLDGGAPIVLTESKAMAAAPPTAEGPAMTALPLTVLVNDHTASASEILAGALKDNCRAVLVGGRTYGKGLIQSVYELSDSSGLVVTVGKYLTPGGVDIDRYGIEPNFKSQPAPQRAEEELAACRLARAPAAAGAAGRAPQELLVTGEGRGGGWWFGRGGGSGSGAGGAAR
ncbi:MAG: ClpP/crotonase [Monoraphidium minutum]|nr:MAG: ClpP/crotonase [Monoraphidium minutum]